MAKNLLIIGNGFDLDLGLKTKYSEYIESAKLRHVMQGNGLFNAICEKYDNCNWIDIELFLKEYFIKLSNKETTHSKIEKEFKELRDDLEYYMTNSVWDLSQTMTVAKKTCIAVKIFKSVISNGKFEILNFNYTNIDELARKLSVAPPQCSYVHGGGAGIKEDIVFGSDDDEKIADEYSFILKSVQKKRSHFIEKKLNDADRIIIFGHSLGETDYHYFRRFFKKQSDSLLSEFKTKSIYIFTKSRDEIFVKLKKMDKSISYQRLRDANDFRVLLPTNFHDISDLCDEIEKW